MNYFIEPTLMAQLLLDDSYVKEQVGFFDGFLHNKKGYLEEYFYVNMLTLIHTW